ncbi:MAG TPA: alkaline phosphatase family protein [Thermoanaerobaculia bacterium]|nr:alkaline phosphatase family protein [Thermoanaerobaculia bacterium]
MTRRLSLLLPLLVLACAPAPQPQTAPPAPRAFATAVAQRVVLLSFDGLGADALARQAGLPAFERLAREGASARVIGVDPTLTGPAHVSILTGADPQRTGIVSNRFHLPGTPPGQMTRAMDTDPDVETIIEAARRQGKRVGVVSFPTIDNRSPRRTADFGLAWSDPLVPARLVTLTRADFKREWVPPTWTARPQRRASFSPVMRARLAWDPSLDVDIVAYDTTDDRIENYDLYRVETEDELPVDADGWFAIAQRTEHGLTGSWSKILRATPALDVTIYRGATSRNEAWPASFRDLVDEHAGFWPGAPEEDLDVGPDVFLEQMERLATYYTRAQLLAIERMPFDLLLLYQPQIDQASHEFLGTADGDRLIRAAFVAADRALARIAESLSPDDALVVTADHGLTVARTQIRMNRLLAERGFAPRWRSYSSGAHAHLYRFGEPDDADAIVNMLTETGLFEHIEKKTAAHHRNGGDVIATALPDTGISNDDVEPSIATPEPYGHHGALNHHRELHPAFLAIGSGVPAGSLGEIRQTAIARFVAELLGITW